MTSKSNYFLESIIQDNIYESNESWQIPINLNIEYDEAIIYATYELKEPKDFNNIITYGKIIINSYILELKNQNITVMEEKFYSKIYEGVFNIDGIGAYGENILEYKQMIKTQDQQSIVPLENSKTIRENMVFVNFFIKMHIQNIKLTENNEILIYLDLNN